MKKVAIIIVNYNGLEYLSDCLTSLKNLDYPNYGGEPNISKPKEKTYSS